MSSNANTIFLESQAERLGEKYKVVIDSLAKFRFFWMLEKNDIRPDKFVFKKVEKKGLELKDFDDMPFGIPQRFFAR